MTVRDERAAALIRRHRDLSDDFTRALPGLLDDLDAIDRANGGQLAADAADAALAHERELLARGDLSAGPATPPDAWIAAWIDANPQKFEAWVRKQNRINGAPPPFAAPAKPVTRRRTAR